MTGSQTTLNDVTPLLISYNEEENIARTLGNLSWAKRVVVVDSGSTDNTLELLEQFSNTEVIHREFDTMARQWNFGLSLVDTEWVLSLDSDYQVSESLRNEIEEVLRQPQNDGYMIPFRYCVFGRPLRASLLPPRCALFRKECCEYYDDGHTQRLKVDGTKGSFHNPILHDDRKPLGRWLRNQNLYLELEAAKISESKFADLPMADKVRALIIPAPFAVLLMCLMGKGCLFDGWRGWFYSLQRTVAELILSLHLIRRKFLP